MWNRVVLRVSVLVEVNLMFILIWCDSIGVRKVLLLLV